MFRRITRWYVSLGTPTRAICAIIFYIVLLWAAQSALIFPGAAISKVRRLFALGSISAPPEVERIVVTTEDAERLDVWRLPVPDSRKVALIFHGNGADVANFFPYQKYFESLGITSYGFDYRGYGASSGWPSETGLEKDTRAVWRYAFEREGVDAKSIIIVGISVGGGPASFAASTFHPGALVLFSPFISLPEAVKDTPLVGFLSSLTAYTFPVAAHVANLNQTCLVVVHGEEDITIPIRHGRAVADSFRGDAAHHFLAIPGAGHNDVLFRGHAQVTEALRRCFE